MRVGIIGSGLAGLSAACTLAARGHSVAVFEKNAWIGGKAAHRPAPQPCIACAMKPSSTPAATSMMPAMR